MELWQMDIVGGVLLSDGAEAKVVTGLNDHSRFCVIAAVVPKATGRAVCLALVAALRTKGFRRNGSPNRAPRQPPARSSGST
jgi:hypothetical protein